MTMKPESVDVLIVGADHAGLAMSGLLTHEGREHVVVDLVGRTKGNDPDGFMSRDEIAARVARYAEVVRAPVLLGTEVHRLAPTEEKRST
jgi:hypothetical protein